MFWPGASLSRQSWIMCAQHPAARYWWSWGMGGCWDFLKIRRSNKRQRASGTVFDPFLTVEGIYHHQLCVKKSHHYCIIVVLIYAGIFLLQTFYLSLIFPKYQSLLCLNYPPQPPSPPPFLHPPHLNPLEASDTADASPPWIICLNDRLGG